jgi:hypothetical protein
VSCRCPLRWRSHRRPLTSTTRRGGDAIWGEGTTEALYELFSADFVESYPPPGVEPNRETY